MQITVQDVQKIVVNEGETLVITVDPDGYTEPQFNKVMQEAINLFRQCFPNPKIGVIAVRKNAINLNVVTSGQHVTNSGTPGSSGNVNDAYDRAMKGLG